VSLSDTTGAGPLWSAGESSTCSDYGVLCLGNHSSRPLAANPSTGRRIWVTQGEYTPGVGAPDDLCMSERPAGVVQAQALLETATRSPVDLLQEGQFVRTDGLLTIGPLAPPRVSYWPRLLLPGPWLTADGTPLVGDNLRAWVGNSCADWQTAAAGSLGRTVRVYQEQPHVAVPPSQWFGVTSSESSLDCSTSAHLLCLEM